MQNCGGLKAADSRLSVRGLDTTLLLKPKTISLTLLFPTLEVLWERMW